MKSKALYFGKHVEPTSGYAASKCASFHLPTVRNSCLSQNRPLLAIVLQKRGALQVCNKVALGAEADMKETTSAMLQTLRSCTATEVYEKSILKHGMLHISFSAYQWPHIRRISHTYVNAKMHKLPTTLVQPYVYGNRQSRPCHSSGSLIHCKYCT